MKKIVSIIIIGILISCSFGVQGIFFERKTSTDESIETVTIGINDLLFDKKMEVLMKLAKFPSISACIIEEDEVIWSRAYGFYDLENGKTATENTIYVIASITKTITGTALMQLWEQDLFDLDEDVNNYLPFSLRNPHFPDDPITFRMLLSHSSSLNDDNTRTTSYTWLNYSGDPPFSFYPYPWLEEHLIPGGKWYNTHRWLSTYKPGECIMYANANYDLIAYLVELISGEIFVEYCKNHIFQPLEMYNTSFNLSELDIKSVAIPYHYHDGEYLQVNELDYLTGGWSLNTEKHPRVIHYPVYGLRTTVDDLSHFFIAHMNSGVWNGNRILEKKTVEEMHTIQPPGDIDQLNNNYGLGWSFQEFPFLLNITFSGHTGGSMGVQTMMYYIPEENIGVIFFTNGDTLYEQNLAVSSIASVILLLNLFKKGGINLSSHIDFGNN